MSASQDALRASAIFNLTGAVVMIVDDGPFSMELTTAALRGFGIRPAHCCRTADEAMEVLRLYTVDLMIANCDIRDRAGEVLVPWLRRSGLEPNAYMPVIMTANHVRPSRLQAVRDAGANYLITKPFSAAVILERIIWLARDARAFLEAGDYKGPDRRNARTEPRATGERRADMQRLTAEQSALAARATDAARILVGPAKS